MTDAERGKCIRLYIAKGRAIELYVSPDGDYELYDDFGKTTFIASACTGVDFIPLKVVRQAISLSLRLQYVLEGITYRRLI